MKWMPVPHIPLYNAILIRETTSTKSVKRRRWQAMDMLRAKKGSSPELRDKLTCHSASPTQRIAAFQAWLFIERPLFEPENRLSSRGEHVSVVV